MSVDARLALLEAGQSRFEVAFRELRDQREAEHRENRDYLQRIDGNSSAAAAGVKALEPRIASVEGWRSAVADDLDDVVRLIRGNDKQPGLVAVFGWIAEIAGFVRLVRRGGKVVAGTLAILAPLAVFGTALHWW